MTLTPAQRRSGAGRSVRADVLIGGDDVYEDLFGVSDALAQLLAENGMAARVRVGTAALLEAAPDLVVLETAVADLSIERVDALVAAVSAGTSLLVVHAGAVLFESAPERRLAELIGARFLSHGPHPHGSRFRVEVDPDHPVTSGLAGFDVDHEHYLLEVAADARPIAWRVTADGREPVAVVRDDAAGRICYIQLGHDTRPFGEPAVRELLERCVRWLTTPMED
ncbi:ThuA domain-containing protein [Microbacterium sp. NPDC058389]|uniref:ThuA domain-containing protein n=1 Tax=Microbacterium sp. NPDC058389 TaxID=3346475 RepID=UPI00366597E4